MAIEKNHIGGYRPQDTARAKSTCLSLAQILGTFMTNYTVIVGGIVPSLLFGDDNPDPVLGPHAGSADVDLTLSLIVLDKERYTNVRDALKARDFAPDVIDSNGKIARQRWRHGPTGALVDFLMPPVPPDEQGEGALKGLERDFAAVTMLGLDLALQHRISIQLEGKDLIGRPTSREVPVCHPAVLVMLKALAISGRDVNKDAYDLFFVLKASPEGPEGLGKFLRRLRPHKALDAMEEAMKDPFKSIESPGPSNVCAFLGVDSDDLRADVLAYANTFLDAYQAAGHDAK